MRANVTPRRLLAMLAVTVALFAAMFFLVPGALPIFPAALVPAIWAAFFAGGGTPSAHERRILVALLIGGVVAFALGLVVWTAAG